MKQNTQQKMLSMLRLNCATSTCLPDVDRDKSFHENGDVTCSYCKWNTSRGTNFFLLNLPLREALLLMLPMSCYIITYATSVLLHYYVCLLCPVTLSLMLPLLCYIIIYVTSVLLHYHLRYLHPVILASMLICPVMLYQNVIIY
jgi:hypothetical protein